MNPVAVTFVVIESQGIWPACFERGPDADVHVVAQQDGEAAADFAERVVGKLETLRLRRLCLGSAVLACNERADRAAMDARYAIASAALSAMAQGPECRLLVTGRDRGAGSARRALCSFAGDLTAKWAESGIPVSVRFDSFVRHPSERVKVA